MWHDPPDVRPADGSGRTPSASASERSIALAFENELAEAEQMLDSGSSRLGVTGARYVQRLLRYAEVVSRALTGLCAAATWPQPR